MIALFALQLLASGWLMEVAVEGPTPWVVHSTPEDPRRPAYPGQVLGATHLDSHREEWSITWAPPREGARTPIARLEDGRGHVLTALDQRGDALGIEVRTRAAALRLRVPVWVMPVPTGLGAGDTLTVQISEEAGQVRMAAWARGDTTARSIRSGAQHGWTLINPFTPAHRTDAAWRRWTVAWLLGWGVLLGWSARGTRRPPWWGAGALALLVILTAWSHTLASPADLASVVAGWVVAGRLSSGPRTPR
jgi:hypothetical protein